MKLLNRPRWLSVVALVTVGCSDEIAGRLSVYPVSGKVLYKGKPLEGAEVVLVAAAAPAGATAPPAPTGTTGADGSFKLTTYEKDDGAPAGKYQVKILTTPPPSADAGILVKREKVVDVLKGKYLDPSKTGLAAVVEEKPTELPPFQLD
jgi:hypothetical protein